jgi:hypothetical protein
MRKIALTAGALASILMFAAQPALAAQSGDQQQVKLATGTWWGKVGDRVELEYKDMLSVRKLTGTITKIEKGILTVDGQIDGRKVVRPIFASEIQSMKTLDGAAPEESAADSGTGGASKSGEAPAPASTDKRLTPKAMPSPGSVGIMTMPGVKAGSGDKELGVSAGVASGNKDAEGYDLDGRGYRISPKKGVFVLPFEEGVGQEARAFEIERMGAEADKWGPGQIIVMEINSPGGLVTEIFKISDTLREVRKRHRVVAWVKKAISAAACTAMHCDEIYFYTVGALGATTMIAGGDSIQGPELAKFMTEMAQEVEYSGRPSAVLFAMIKADRILTYTKDPVTGKPVFHDSITGLPGEVVLSDEKDNLVLNATNAFDSGFSNGIADTPEELAKLMGLPEWYEISDFGRKIAKAWNVLYKQCEADIDRQMQRMNIQRGSAVEQLMARIQGCEALLAWTKKCKPCSELKGVDPDRIQRILDETRRQLAEARKAEQQNRRSS